MQIPEMIMKLFLMKDTPSKKSLLFRNQKLLILNYVLIWSRYFIFIKWTRYCDTMACDKAFRY